MFSSSAAMPNLSVAGCECPVVEALSWERQGRVPAPVVKHVLFTAGALSMRYRNNAAPVTRLGMSRVTGCGAMSIAMLVVKGPQSSVTITHPFEYCQRLACGCKTWSFLAPIRYPALLCMPTLTIAIRRLNKQLLRYQSTAGGLLTTDKGSDTVWTSEQLKSEMIFIHADNVKFKNGNFCLIAFANKCLRSDPYPSFPCAGRIDSSRLQFPAGRCSLCRPRLADGPPELRIFRKLCGPKSHGPAGAKRARCVRG